MRSRRATFVLFALVFVGAVATLVALWSLLGSDRDALRALRAPDRAQYSRVLNPSEWKNPFLVVHIDHVEVQGIGDVAFDRLEVTLRGLPREAWPYGRVVAVQDVGIVDVGRASELEARKKAVVTLLESLGIEVNHWPS